VVDLIDFLKKYLKPQFWLDQIFWEAPVNKEEVPAAALGHCVECCRERDFWRIFGVAR
jgi:hypothetical protein